MSRTYRDTVEWIFKQLPMYQRVGTAAYREGLDGIQALCALAGNPQRSLGSVIHVAGTNGKGSVSHALAAVLQEHGYKVGLYSSPHLQDFRERIKINGQMIEEAFVVEFIESMRPKCADLNPSFFEYTTLMAFAWFARAQLDFTVVECGLGGRLDSTNVVQPALCAITHVDWDHASILGDTLVKIAFQKAGIIKQGAPVVLGRTQDPEIDAVFEQEAHRHRCLVYRADQTFRLERMTQAASPVLWQVYRHGQAWREPLTTDLLGNYQAENLGHVLAVIECLQNQGWDMSWTKTWQALSSVSARTGFAGRWQLLGRNPDRVVDVAHNHEGVSVVVQQALQGRSPGALHLVLGMSTDKDHEAVLKLLPAGARYYFCAPNLERAFPAKELSLKASSYGLTGNTYESVELAWESACREANTEDLVLGFGSFFVVAEIFKSL
jgi:dihydrofolate synthase/folylpolyglutamate synthase